MKTKDDLIKGMFRDHAVESPRKGFTEGVMSKINSVEELAAGRLLTPLQWVLIASGVAAAILVIIFLDLPFLNNLFSFEGLSEVQFSGIGKRMGDFLESLSGGFRFTSITIMIVSAVLMLLGIDRIVKHRQDQVQIF